MYIYIQVHFVAYYNTTDGDGKLLNVDWRIWTHFALTNHLKYHFFSDAREVFDLFDFWDGRDGDVDAFKIGDVCRCLGINPTNTVIKKNGGTDKMGKFSFLFWGNNTGLPEICWNLTLKIVYAVITITNTLIITIQIVNKKF